MSQNAGASVLQNAPNQPLNVIGAPANSAVADAKTDTKWVVLFILLFAVLIGPAVVYLREMQVAEQVDTTKVAATVVPKKSAETEKPQTKKTTQSNQKEKPKKKAKKGTSNKAKRGKKKK